MPVDIRVPSLGESIVEATIGRWLKHEGDTVNQGEALVELETDKVNMEVGADQSGVLQKIVKQEGDTVAVGEVLGVIGESSQAPATQAGDRQKIPSEQLQSEPVASETSETLETSETGFLWQRRLDT